jgi:protocatechuate 3,4-dioxygenase beta subunit
MRNRGGSGVLRLLEQGDLHIAEHNIVLGLNIPDYPEKYNTTESSGRAVGEDIMSFTPFHAYGPDKGSKTCPICKYGRYHGILYFVGDNPNWDTISMWLKFLESESKIREKYLKAYFVYGNDKNYNEALIRQQLEALGEALNIEYTALTFVPSFSDKASDIDLNRINTKVENTFLIYKHSNIVAKFINLTPTPENFDRISEALDATQGDYFQLSQAKPRN